MIEIQGLTRRFGAFALQGIDLTIERGAYAVILGPSGSGKTLLLSTLAGLHRAEAGTLRIDGQDVTATPPEERGLGVVYQGSALFPHLSVAANIGFGLRARRTPRAARAARVAELCRELDLTALLKRPTSSLSGGEAQKVAIARALAAHPRALLLDEPLSQIDHHQRLELQQTLRKTHRALGLTTLHVTHNREEAHALGDFFAILLGGRIVQAGPAAQVRETPACLFVQKFLGLGQESVITPQGACTECCLGGQARCDRAGGGHGS